MGAPINMGKNKGRRADQSSDSLGERSKIPKMIAPVGKPFEVLVLIQNADGRSPFDHADKIRDRSFRRDHH